MPKTLAMDGYVIRQATQPDLLQIHDWLKHEYDTEPDRSFFCNYNLIEAGQDAGSLSVLVRESDSVPVAFCLGKDEMAILAVKADCRRKGFGRHLAEHFIRGARSRDIVGLCGQCAPTSSAPFWKSLSFVSVPAPAGGDDPHWIALPLPRDNTLPDGQPRESVVVTLADHMHETRAVSFDGGHLLEREFVAYARERDERIEIQINGTEVYAGKVAYVSQVGGERDAPWVRVRELRVG